MTAADVLIIGGGLSGGVAALRFAQAGFSVVCLEQGDWPDRSAIAGDRPEWELTARKQWSSSAAVRAGPGDYQIDTSESALFVGNYNGVGGGTVLYNAVWPRLTPSDFAVRTLDGVADDWPITYDELAPYYDRVDREFGVSGLGGNPVYPPGIDPPLPPLPIGKAGLRLARAHKQLGWHWWPETNAILSAPHDGRHACVQRGTCSSGCNEGAKASTDLVHFPRAAALGARIITGATVSRILVDHRGAATGAEWIDRNGRVHVQDASLVLCAANAIGTARLLLLSADSAHPDGLANSSGLVGRNLMFHLTERVTGYFDEGLDSWQGQFGGAIQAMEFYGTDPSRDFVRGARWSLAPTGGPVTTALPWGTRPVFGVDHHEFMRVRFGRGASWIMLYEELPNVENRIELTDEVRDNYGLPSAKVVYHVSDNSERMATWNADRATESMRAAGAHLIEHGRSPSNAHLTGTARMGDDRRTSVVNRWGVAHDVPNLAIVDGSVFVTQGAVNPSATIAALALRTVEHLIDQRADLTAHERPRSFALTGTRVGSPSVEPERGALWPASTVSVALSGAASDEAIDTDGTLTLDESKRALLRELADELIPAGDGRPGASDVGAADDLLDWVLSVRPDLRDAIRRVAEWANTASDSADIGALHALRRSDPSAYHAFVLAVVAGYYRHPTVKERIGYPGQIARPVNALEYPAYLSEGLLDHLIDG